MIKKLLITLIFTMTIMPVQAARFYKESYYQEEWAQQWRGVCEYKLPDGTRVDVMTKNFAVEFDFAKKWAEAVGQALHYGRMTGKKPAIVLIIETPSDFKYYKRVEPLCKQYGITLWYMKSPLYKWNRKIDLTLRWWLNA